MRAVQNLIGAVLVEYIMTAINFISRAGYHIVCLVAEGGKANKWAYIHVLLSCKLTAVIG